MDKIIKFIFVILIMFFIFLMIASKSGYYEYELSQKRKLTDEAIEKFENDVALGKSIDINNYLDNKSKDYSNKFSKLGNSISETVENIFSKGIGYIFKYINKELED